MSTRLPTQTITGLVPRQLSSALLMAVGYLKSLVKWVVVVNVVGVVAALWIDLIRIHLDLGQPNKAALTLGLLIFTVFASLGWLYQLGVFTEVDLGVTDKFDIGESSPT